MQHGAGVGRKNSGARTPPTCLATPFLTGSPRSLFCPGHSLALTQEGPLNTSDWPLVTSRCSTFLPGSGLRVEFAVTHSKQTTAPFLPGSRIARCHARSSSANALSNRELELLEPRLTHRKQTTAPRSNRELSTNRCRANSHAVIPILTFLTGLPRAFFANSSVCAARFLPGSGLRVEFAVTHSK